METVGVRGLQQHASAWVAQAAQGAVITVTDRGRPVAQLVPLASGRLAQLRLAGHARPPRSRLADLPAPMMSQGPSLSSVLAAQRESERY